jgi:8-oxo-dGTP pyrophosphatase MutT (NUDIX family)
MSKSLAAVAVAILYQEGKFLMQLRDDFPGIIYPGHWGLFGGHLEPGETPEAALKRELLEEINYAIPLGGCCRTAAPIKFRSYADNRVIRHVFHAPLQVSLDALVLNEGWDLGLVKLEDIQRGKCYSSKAGQERPLGDIHQRILLEFVARA